MADISSRLPTTDQSDGSTGATAPTTAIETGGVYNNTLPTLTNGQLGSIQLDSSARQIVNVAVTAPPSNLLATGTLTGTGQTVTLTIQGTASINVDVSGPGFVGTITITENTPSQSRTLGVFALNSSAIAMNITANGNYRVAGVPTSNTIQVQFSSYTSGSATINIYGSTAPYIVQPYSANAANLLSTSYLNDGSGNSLSSTSGSLNVNLTNSIPSGTNTIGSLNNISGTISLPTGAATLAAQNTGNTSLANIDAGIPAALGATSSANSMPVVDIISTSAQQQSQTVTTTAAVALGGASPLTNRKLIVITPTTGTIYWGISSGVTTSTGQPIFANNTLFLSFSIPVYVIAASSITAIITEAS